MKTFKKIHREDIEVTDTTTCDICKRVYKDDNWGKGDYVVMETCVKIKNGFSSPEAGYGKEISFDICPDCFKNTIIPFLESLGVKAVEKDWDW